MKNNLPTEAGQTKANVNTPSANPSANKDGASQKPGDAMIDAINQVFALFKLNYHNQYYKAFSQSQDVNSTKRFWLESLQRFSPDTLLRGAKSVMQSSEYLPTLHTMLKHCEAQSHHSFPDAHSAYIEACRASSPKAEYSWSHPAIYYAGKQVDWYFLLNNIERVAFPIFKQAYQEVCERVLKGETLSLPTKLKLPREPEPVIDKNVSMQRIKDIRAFLDD